MDHGTLYTIEAGTPQGSVASPVLANLTVDGLEGALRKRCPTPKSGDNAQGNLGRYGDDWLITARSQEALEPEVNPLVENFLAERGLCLSPDTTVITQIDKGVDCLGQHVRKYHGKRRITPSRQSMTSRLGKGREIIKVNKPTPAGHLLGQLNPLVRGWANYHRHVVRKGIVAKMAHAIFQALWRWAKRRHPNKPPGWMRRTYCTHVAGNRWVF
jgi:RNA-directed DNA polymerase